MVMRPRFRPVLPRHSSCLDLGDYLTYVTSGFAPRNNQAPAMQELWKPLLGQCRIVPTSTGRQALWDFLEIAGLQEGDEVLVSAYNFYVIIRILLQKKLVPVFVDIDPETLCMDPKDVMNKLTGRSRMVLVTHMFGNPADMGQITRICRENGLLIFEDCAHAVGTSCGTTHVGQFGDGGLFSFGIYKIVNAFGGGMLVFRNTEVSRAPADVPQRAASGLASFSDNLVRCLVSGLLHPMLHTLILYPSLKLSKRLMPRLVELVDPSGNDPTYVFRLGDRAPFKPYMTRMIRRQLARLEAHIGRRRAIVEAVKTALSDLDDIVVLHEDKHGRSNCSYLGIGVPDPEDLARYLEAHRILSNPHEYYDCSSLPQFSAFQCRCEHAAYAAQHILRIPNFPSLRDEDVGYMIATIRAYFTKRRAPAAGREERAVL